MTKLYQYLALVTILCLSFHETMSEMTEMCVEDTAALGDIATNEGQIEAFDINSADCEITLESGLAVNCDFLETDRSTECVAQGGRAILATQTVDCDNLDINIINLPLCFGMSCNIKNVVIAAEETLRLQFDDVLDVLPGALQVDVDTCVITLTPPAADGGGSFTAAGKDSSGPFAEPFVCLFLMAIAPLLLIIV